MRTLTVLSPVLVAALAGCPWDPDPNDDGDEAFVSQAIEAVLGRKPKGAAEVRAYADLVASHGREAAVDVLFEQPEYVAYWSQVLADDLEVQRAAPMALDANCAAPPLLPAWHSEGLAAHLATADPEEPYCWSLRPQDPPVIFTESQFWRVYGAAEDRYRYTPVTRLTVPEPLTRPVPPPRPIDPPRDSEPSRWPDLEVEGAGPSNGDFRFDDGRSRVAHAVDQKRYDAVSARGWFEDCPPFNLTDVVQAAVRADRLDAAYRAYLPVLATFPGTGSDFQMRQQLGGAFLDVYVDRDTTCMSCHTATYSRTDPRPLNANWDRFYPVWYGLAVPLDAEGTVFSHDLSGGDFLYGGDGGTDVLRRTGNLFRAQNHVASGVLPWGFDDACVTNPGRGFGGFDPTLPTDTLSGAGDTAFAELGPSKTLGVLDLAGALSDASASFASLDFVVPDWETYRTARGAGPPAEDPICFACHDPAEPTADPAAPLLEHKVPTMSDQRLFSIIRNGSGQMPPQTSSDAEAWDFVWWVRENFPQSPALQMEDRNHAFLYLMSANVVNQVVDELLGEDLLMIHGFSRNPDQAHMLSTLTMSFAEHYSLKDLLREIVLSGAFNRKPPEDPGTSPYVLEMLPFPEAAVSPLATDLPLGANANSEGDYVHKVSPAGLLHQVHEALGWPAPPIVGDPVVYPSQELMTAIGRYTSRAQREREHFAIDTFLSWETEVATCRKPEEVRARDVNLVPGTSVAPGDVISPDQWVDWIDLLAADAETTGPTWSELALATKDRLLADPSFLDGEEKLLTGLWGVDLSATPLADGAMSTDEVELLRDYCGMLMATPDFVLRGVRLAPPIDPRHDPDPVCLPGEVCGEGQLHGVLVGTAEDLGHDPLERR